MQDFVVEGNHDHRPADDGRVDVATAAPVLERYILKSSAQKPMQALPYATAIKQINSSGLYVQRP